MNSFGFALLAASLWGVAPVFARMGLAKADPLLALTVRSSVITAILWVVVTVSGRLNQLFAIAPRSAGFIAMEGVTASLLGHLALYWALKTGEASVVTPVTSAYPIITIILAAVFLGEQLTVAKILGTAIVLAGLYVIRM
ncbi:MAG: EamA family transporter [Bacillota bacterium]